MKIVPIFEDFLYAFHYEEELHDEFSRLFDQWHDVEYLEQFFEDNITDLQNDFWGSVSVTEAIEKTIIHVSRFENELLDAFNKPQKYGINKITSLFIPLVNSQISVITLKKSKAKKGWLRLYALEIECNSYIITGGAIKLTATMNEREHTRHELVKLEMCRNFLIENGIIDNDGIVSEIEI